MSRKQKPKPVKIRLKSVWVALLLAEQQMETVASTVSHDSDLGGISRTHKSPMSPEYLAVLGELIDGVRGSEPLDLPYLRKRYPDLAWSDRSKKRTHQRMLKLWKQSFPKDPVQIEQLRIFLRDGGRKR
jgi:hypothetical protein